MSMGQRALLIRYLRALIAEENNARVPNQLISPDTASDDNGQDEEAELDEFCGAGGGGNSIGNGNVMGYSGGSGEGDKKSKMVRK